jgi:6-pyruvoyl-tetrahydropterin synthase
VSAVGLTYRRSFKVPFSSARMIGEVISGHTFNAVIVIEAEQLSEDGLIIEPSVIHRLVVSLDHINLNERMNPMIPTTENLAKFVGQMILDYLFKAGLEGEVRLLLVRITEAEGDFAEVVYAY